MWVSISTRFTGPSVRGNVGKGICCCVSAQINNSPLNHRRNETRQRILSGHSHADEAAIRSHRAWKGGLPANSVEKVSFVCGALRHLGCRNRRLMKLAVRPRRPGDLYPSLCRNQVGLIRCGYQPFRNSAQILGGCHQQELIVGSAEAAQSQLVRFHDALEVGANNISTFLRSVHDCS